MKRRLGDDNAWPLLIDQNPPRQGAGVGTIGVLLPIIDALNTKFFHFRTMLVVIYTMYFHFWSMLMVVRRMYFYFCTMLLVTNMLLFYFWSMLMVVCRMYFHFCSMLMVTNILFIHFCTMFLVICRMYFYFCTMLLTECKINCARKLILTLKPVFLRPDFSRQTRMGPYCFFGLLLLFPSRLLPCLQRRLPPTGGRLVKASQFYFPVQQIGSIFAFVTDK